MFSYNNTIFLRPKIIFHCILFDFSLKISCKDGETDRALNIMQLDKQRGSLFDVALEQVAWNDNTTTTQRKTHRERRYHSRSKNAFVVLCLFFIKTFTVEFVSKYSWTYVKLSWNFININETVFKEVFEVKSSKNSLEEVARSLWSKI